MDVVHTAPSKDRRASSITVRCCVMQQPLAGMARTNQTVPPLNSSSLMCSFSAHKKLPLRASV